MKKRDTIHSTPVFNPPIHRTEDSGHIHLSIVLPGVAEEQIRIDLENTAFTISISDNGKTLRKSIRVPQGVRFFRKKFSEGILEIFLEKPLQ